MSGFRFQFSDFSFTNHASDFELIWLHTLFPATSAHWHCTLPLFLGAAITNKAANATASIAKLAVPEKAAMKWMSRPR